MKLFKVLATSVVLPCVLAIGVLASNTFIADDAKVLKSSTVSTVEQNFTKVKSNTDVTVKFDIVQSLGGKSINDYASKYAKDNISGDAYVLYVVSVGDKCNKVLVGSKANNVLSSDEAKSLESLPNADFLKKDFDSGIMKVGKELDTKVTTKAVKAGVATVNKDGLSTSVQHKTNWLKVFGVLLLITAIVVILVILFKRKADKEYKERTRTFAHENGLDEFVNEDGSFRSANVDKESPQRSSSSQSFSQSRGSSQGMNGSSGFGQGIGGRQSFDSSSRDYSTNNNNHSHGCGSTTIINNNNNTSRGSNSDFVDGVMLGEIMAESHEHHHHHEERDYDYTPRHEEHHYDDYTPSHSSYSHEDSSPSASDNTEYTSGSWDTSGGTSWDSDGGTSWDGGSDSGFDS